MKKAAKPKVGKPKAAAAHPAHPAKVEGKKADEPGKTLATHHPKPGASHGNLKVHDLPRKGSVSKPTGSHKSDASHGATGSHKSDASHGAAAKHDTAKRGSVSKPAPHKSDALHASPTKHDASRKSSLSKSVGVKSTSDTDSSEPPLSERSETQSVGDHLSVEEHHSVGEPLLLSTHGSPLHHQGFSMSDHSFVESVVDEEESPVMALSQLRMTGPAPDFKGTAVFGGDFKNISLSDYKGKYLVFFFYPLDFTFVCPTELIAFSDRAEEFRSIGCEVVACSTDSHFSHLAWVETPRKQGGLGDMKIPLLSDKTGEIARAYGVYKDADGVAFRGLFIIDAKGNLRQVTINDMPVGRSVDETLRLVQAFQFTDKHGEVCPAGWKPGKDTMKPNPKESKAYFQKHP